MLHTLVQLVQLVQDDPPQDDPPPPKDAPAPRRRRVREGPRPKRHSPRALRREVFRRGPEARGDEKVVQALAMRETRPVTRGECRDDERPCPWVSCRYHLALSVNPETGAITINFPDREVWELEETCALDVAERGGATLEEVGKIINVTRERIRQMETIALIKLKKLGGSLR